jgi:hypothetical protein
MFLYKINIIHINGNIDYNFIQIIIFSIDVKATFNKSLAYIQARTLQYNINTILGINFK